MLISFCKNNVVLTVLQQYEKKERFTNKLGQKINKYRINHEEANTVYNLSAELKLQYLCSLFDGKRS